MNQETNARTEKPGRRPRVLQVRSNKTPSIYRASFQVVPAFKYLPGVGKQMIRANYSYPPSRCIRAGPLVRSCILKLRLILDPPFSSILDRDRALPISQRCVTARFPHAFKHLRVQDIRRSTRSVCHPCFSRVCYAVLEWNEIRGYNAMVLPRKAVLRARKTWVSIRSRDETVAGPKLFHLPFFPFPSLPFPDHLSGNMRCLTLSKV